MLVTDVPNGPLVSSSEPLTPPEALAGQPSALGSAAGFLTREKSAQTLVYATADAVNTHYPTTPARTQVFGKIRRDAFH